MRQAGSRWFRATAAGLCVALGTSSEVLAAGTRAGTTIDNTAVVSFRIGGADEILRAQAPRLTVAEIVELGGAPLAPTTVVQAGSSGRTVGLRVANLGNGIETVSNCRPRSPATNSTRCRRLPRSTSTPTAPRRSPPRTSRTCRA
jgi:hypothetical protein